LLCGNVLSAAAGRLVSCARGAGRRSAKPELRKASRRNYCVFRFWKSHDSSAFPAWPASSAANERELNGIVAAKQQPIDFWHLAVRPTAQVVPNN
jgi:hypothetical protein